MSRKITTRNSEETFVCLHVSWTAKRTSRSIKIYFNGCPNNEKAETLPVNYSEYSIIIIVVNEIQIRNKE